MSERITFEEMNVLEGYKKDGLGFPHPSEILFRFTKVVNKLGENELLIKVDKEGGAITQDHQDIKSYGRGVITATFDGMISAMAIPVIGIIWAYDITKPYLKMFFGLNATACTNLMVFGVEDIKIKYLNKPRKNDKEGLRKWDRSCRDAVDDIIYAIEDLIENISSRIEEYGKIIRTFQTTLVKGEEITKFIGNIYINEVINGNFDYSTFNEGCRLTFDDNYQHPNKKLYEPQIIIDTNGEQIMELSMYQFYGALTQRITDGGIEINDVPDKTLRVGKTILKYCDEFSPPLPVEEEG